jgi:hypothetical protein
MHTIPSSVGVFAWNQVIFTSFRIASALKLLNTFSFGEFKISDFNQ